MNYTELYPQNSFTVRINTKPASKEIYKCWLPTLYEAKFTRAKKDLFKNEVIFPAIDRHALNMAFKTNYGPLIEAIKDSEDMYLKKSGTSFFKEVKEFCLKSYFGLKDNVEKIFLNPMAIITFILYEDYLKVMVEGGGTIKRLDYNYSFHSAKEASIKIIEGYNKLNLEHDHA